MKWSLFFLAGILCSFDLAHGDAAGDLYTKGVAADNAGDSQGALTSFDEIISSYPTFSSIDDVRLRAGLDYAHLGDEVKAIDRFSKIADKTARPTIRGIALFYTGLAQLTMSGKAADANARTAALTKATATFTDLVNFIAATPTPENNDLLEDALYYRSLVEFQARNMVGAEKDLLQVIQQFGASLRQPDYQLLLGSVYASETGEAMAGRKPTDPTDAVRALAAKSLDAFDRVSKDPNALVQANEADMRKAEVYYLIAQLDFPSTDGYAKALDAYRQVKRKDDLIPAQTQRLADLKLKAQSQVASAGGSSGTARLIEREQERLTELQTDVDPIIQALVGIGECYNAMKQGDEARTVLHRLAKADLKPAQQQTVDFQIIYSYALSGQTDKADAALTDYITKHPDDKQADSISYQLATNLVLRKDYTGALAQANRSIKDFPQGTYIAAAWTLKAEVLKDLNRLPEADDALAQAAKLPGQGLLKYQNLLTSGQSKEAQGDLAGALGFYKQVMDDPAAKELQPTGNYLYIHTLMSLNRFDDVINESKAFATKYPDGKLLSGALVLGGVAMDKKNDPGAVAALQDVARKFPKDDAASSYALFAVVDIYNRANKVPEMIQAAHDLRNAFPTAYPMLIKASDFASAALVKQKKYVDAIAEYKPLVDATATDVAMEARTKIADLWRLYAKSMGAYQSMQQQSDRDEGVKRITTSEQTYIDALKAFPGELEGVGTAFKGLADDLVLRRSWGLLKDEEMEAFLTTETAPLNTPEMQTRVELAKAALVFIQKDGRKQFPAALDRFKKAVDANPTLVLTREEVNQFGELLAANKDYDRALTVYNNLLSTASPKDQRALADGYYGLGATYLAQGKFPEASEQFQKMKSSRWHPHILVADYGIARAQENSGNPADVAAAKQMYATLMTSSQATAETAGLAMLGYGRILEKAGHGLMAPGQTDIEYALHYYQQVNTFYGPATPEISAEGLFLSGQLYEKNNDNANAKAQFNQIVTTYGTAAPDWADKAKAELAKLGG